MPALQELARCKYGFHYTNPHLFTACFWQKDKTKLCSEYEIYRYIMAAMFTILSLMSFSGCLGKTLPRGTIYSSRWFSYFSNWSLIFMLVYYDYYACLLVLKRLNYNINHDYSFFWALHSVMAPTALFSNIVCYWPNVYPYLNSEPLVDGFVGHLLLPVFTVADEFIVAIPRQPYHFFNSLIILTSYFIFSGTYYAYGGAGWNGKNSVYPFTDWMDSISVFTAYFCGMTLIMIFHFYVYLIYIFKMSLNPSESV